MQEKKSWYLSQTIWASLISVFIGMGSYLGMEFDWYRFQEDEFAEKVVQLISGFAGLFAIWGRIKAKRIIE